MLDLAKMGLMMGEDLTDELREMVLWLNHATTEAEIVRAAEGIHSDAIIGPIMAACRRKSGLSQELLANRLFCEQSTVSKIEHGSQVVKMDYIQQWAKATGCKEFLIAYMYGNKGLVALQRKLQLEGFWKGKSL